MRWSVAQGVPGPAAAGAPALAVRGGRLVCGYPAAGGLWLSEWSGGAWGRGRVDGRVEAVRGVALAGAGDRLVGLVVDGAGGLWRWCDEELAQVIGAADPGAAPGLAEGGAAWAWKDPRAEGLWFAGRGEAPQRIAEAVSDAGPAVIAGEEGWLCAFRVARGRPGGPTWRIGQALAVVQRGEDGWSAPLVIGGPIGGAPALSRWRGAVVAAWADPRGALRWASIELRGWAEARAIEGPEAATGPALAVMQGRLVCAWTGADGRVWACAGAPGRGAGSEL